MPRTLLYLARDLPIPISGAARLRTYNWLIHLSRHFEITFVAPVQAPVDPSYVDVLTPYCAAVHTPLVVPQSPLRGLLARVAAEAASLGGNGPPEAFHLQHGEPAALLARLGRDTRFDVVFAERWTWGASAPRLGRSAVLDAGGVFAPRVAAALRMSRNPVRRLLHGWLGAQARRREALVLGRYGLVLTHSPIEERQILELCAEARTISLPSGLDVRYFEPARAETDAASIVFYGALDSPAQRDALLHLQRDIMPLVHQRRPNAAVTVVDETPIDELLEAADDDTRLVFTGAVDDVRVPLRRAAVAAMPLRFGSGSRSRMAQLLALGIPIVATPYAARGLGVRSGDGVLIVGKGAEFARVLGDVLTDASLREDLSRRARQTAEAHFSIAATYELLSTQLAGTPAPD